jgi:dTDP-glucose 4,6-dehydratase
MRLQPREFAALDAQAERCAAFRSKRIFLTGASGFFGKWLLESFLHVNELFGLNARLTALSRDPQTFLSRYPWFAAEAALTFTKGDVRDFTFPCGTFDFIIHAATEASAKLDKEDPAEMYSVIVDGTKRMLEFAAQAGTNRFMMISSGAVYGVQPFQVPHVPETYAGTPVTAYGKGKLLAEQLCVEAGDRHGFSVLLPRCFAFVGPYLNLDIHFAVGNFIRACLDDRPITIHGDGTPLRAYLYAADLVEWLWTILLNGKHARPYNVGSDEALSIRDLAHNVRACAGTDNTITILGTPDPSVPPPRYVPSIERAKTELGLYPRCPLDEAIRRTLAWHRAGTATSE